MNERRILWLLVLLLLGQLVFLGVQVSGEGREGTILERTLVRALAPIGRGVSEMGEAAETAAESLASRPELLEENRELEREVERLRLELLRLRDVDRDSARLAAALGYDRPFEGELEIADVVFADYASQLRTLILFVGGDAEVEPDHPVVAPEGLVGRVVLTAGPYAKVQLLTDRAAGVGVMIERTRRQGVARGAPEGQIELDFVPLQTDVRAGDRVVTSGIDGIYPRGIPIGTVVEAEPGDQLFYRIEVAPAVEFGRLDQAWVIVRDPVPSEVRDAEVGTPPPRLALPEEATGLVGSPGEGEDGNAGGEDPGQ